MTRFAIIGCGGYVAPRHLQAIEDVGGELVAACDISDSVGILDRYNPDCAFFTDSALFERHLLDVGVDFLAVCTPNHLHVEHIQLGFRAGADVICEKPLVHAAYGLDVLADAERISGQRVFNVLQLRLLPELIALRDRMSPSAEVVGLPGALPRGERADVELTYVTRRGPWYAASWKGDPARSGGLGMNIGIHFFDLLQWVFGRMQHAEVHLRTADVWAGRLELERANVRWFLSTNEADLPAECFEAGRPAFRSIVVDGAALEFSGGFTALHSQVYADVVNAGGWGLDDVRPAIDIVDAVKWAPKTTPKAGRVHSKIWSCEELQRIEAGVDELRPLFSD